MELVKVQLARAIWLFDAQELNPLGIALYPAIYAAFSKRYQFAVLPKPEEVQSGGSLYFKQGKFVHELSTLEVDFELHADGLVANSRHSTEASDAFLQDCLMWLGEQLSVAYPPRLTRKRLYRSELVVVAAPKLDRIADKLERFSKALSEMSKRPIELTGLLFGAENLANVFILDRRVNTPFEDQRYYSSSSLQTSAHLAALKVFEDLMAE
jgi:hypothetical protein